MRLVLAAALAVAAASPATAVVYDAFTSFTGTNTGGAFTYGSLDDTNGNSAFTLYNDKPGCETLISNVICTSNGNLPAAFKSTSGAHPSGTVVVPGNALVLHPGPDAGESSAVVFTAPADGFYYARISAFVADTNPSGTILEVVVPGLLVAPLAEFTTTSSSFFYNDTLGFLPAGFQVGLAVNYDGLYYDDSTGLQFTVATAPIPEPATWGLMVGGFGLIGVAARRRKVAPAA